MSLVTLSIVLKAAAETAPDNRYFLVAVRNLEVAISLAHSSNVLPNFVEKERSNALIRMTPSGNILSWKGLISPSADSVLRGLRWTPLVGQGQG